MRSSNVRDHNHGITAYMVLAHQISKSGSWDHGKINHEITGSYIFMKKRLFWSWIIKSQKSGSWDHGKICYEIIGSYIFMIKDHGIIHFYDLKNLDHEKWFT